MLKYIIIIAALFICVSASESQTILGEYMLGEQKISVTNDEMSYYVYYENDKTQRRLNYEENNLENEQIWTEWDKGSQSGTFVFKADYSSAIYTNYRTDKEDYVKKISH
jgi:hypothetical protein